MKVANFQNNYFRYIISSSQILLNVYKSVLLLSRNVFFLFCSFSLALHYILFLNIRHTLNTTSHSLRTSYM